MLLSEGQRRRRTSWPPCWERYPGQTPALCWSASRSFGSLVLWMVREPRISSRQACISSSATAAYTAGAIGRLHLTIDFGNARALRDAKEDIAHRRATCRHLHCLPVPVGVG